MKKIGIIFILMLIFCQLSLSLSCFFPYYEISENKVFYTSVNGRILVKNVDIESFVKIDFEFAKDKKNVYYTGKVLSNIDVNTFEIVTKLPWRTGCHYSEIESFKDKNGIYQIEDIRKGTLKLTD